MLSRPYMQAKKLSKILRAARVGLLISRFLLQCSGAFPS